MLTIGVGVKEIRIRQQNQYRIIYVAKFQEAIYVLHAFVKKTQKTTTNDLVIARKYYQEVIEMRKKL